MWYIDFLIFGFSFLRCRSSSSIKVMENVLEDRLSIKKMKSDQTYRKNKLAEIVITICALFNSYGGGKFSIKFADESILPEEVDDVLRMIEQRLVDTIGSCTFYTKVMIQRSKVNNLDFFVSHTESLCTVDYKLYLPTQTQVISISTRETPEQVKAILNREVDQQLTTLAEIENFVCNSQVSFTEGDSIQFKQLKAENSKCVSFADRVTNKSNKLERYLSAFADKKGGRLYCGITNGGIVEGEVIEEKDREEIIKKVTKTISNMKWYGGKLEKGKHWNIQFVQVKDENMMEIPSLYVVVISIAALRGGLFTQEPESYHVVQGQIERMSFPVWMYKFFDGVMVPSFVGRSPGSSKKIQRIWCQVLQQLMTHQNDGKYPAFKKCAELERQRYPNVIEVQLIILEQTSAQAHKRGEMKKADQKFKEFEDKLQREDNTVVFKLRAIYAKSAISRAKGDYKESYEIAQEGLQLVEMAPAGILTAWFYNHVAMVETILSQQTKESDKKSQLANSALQHYTKALEHTQASSIEQEFPTIIADLQQRILTCRAITTLGDFAKGANFKQATPSDIKAAKTDLTDYKRLVKLHSVTSYRKIYYLLAKSDLRVCKWWQQRQQQDERSLQNSGSPKYLKKAFVCATKAKDLATMFHFQEMNNYACNRLAKITEIMIKLKFSSMCFQKNNNNQ